MITKVSVFCSSSDKISDHYFAEADKLGKTLAELNIVCYTGAGNSGLMYEVEKSVLQNGGKCVGVIPQFMIDKKWLYEGLSEVISVNTMAERKDILREVADAIIVLPGGVGTLDELFETLALKQLGIFLKPIIIINTNGYFDEMLQLLRKTILENFMQETNISMWQVIESADKLKEVLANSLPCTENNIRFTYIES